MYMYAYIYTYIKLYTCNIHIYLACYIIIKICFIGPLAQWNTVTDFLTTTYTVTWTSKKDGLLHAAILTDQTSYTITGLTHETVYTITLAASNMCGSGPRFETFVYIPPMNIIPSASSISPTGTVSTTPMTIISTAVYTTVISFYSAIFTVSSINCRTTVGDINTTIMVPAANHSELKKLVYLVGLHAFKLLT